MSLFSTIQGDAEEAQGMVAQMQGMSSGGTNALINGTAIVMHFGSPIVQEVAQPGGGFRRRIGLPASLTRTQQLQKPPEAHYDQIVRTDITPQVTYRIEMIDTHDPVRYNLMLVKLGE